MLYIYHYYYYWGIILTSAQLPSLKDCQFKISAERHPTGILLSAGIEPGIFREAGKFLPHHHPAAVVVSSNHIKRKLMFVDLWVGISLLTQEAAMA